MSVEHRGPRPGHPAGLSTRRRRPRCRLATGHPHWRRVSAWVLDLALFAVTLGIGWSLWVWRDWARRTTPGKSLLGLTVFDTDTRRPAPAIGWRWRALVYQVVVVLLGVVTLGLGWLYCVGAALGANRRTVYDEWSHAVVLERPRQAFR
jgi:hypothetical protein